MMSKDIDYPDLKKDKLKVYDFLSNYNENGSFKYMEQLQEIANRTSKVLAISLDDIQSHKRDEAFLDAIISNTARFIHLFEEVADELMPLSRAVASQMDIFDILQNQRNSVHNRDQPSDLNNLMANAGQIDNTNKIPQVLSRRFTVSFILMDVEQPRRLRDIKASDIGHLVLTRGMITRVSEVKPHISVCTYTCDVCGSESFQEIFGHQFLPLLRCTSSLCKESKSKGRLQMQLRGSKFSKYQEIRIQELPDQVPIGNIPRSISVHCIDEETRKCSPGDIVRISGVLMVQRQHGFKAITAGLQAETYIKANSIEKEKLSYETISNTCYNNDEGLRNLVLTENPYLLLSQSLAPEIFGHEDIKKALLLQLVGGVCRTLPDGVKLRGDVNICLMGDPGLAKSQLLKYVASVAPRGVYTTGKGSSGVGLTAAVVRDNFSGEMSLEGGALVLADMGICCIDEFDKMNDSDRTAIHEVMEQQTVSIAKAGISTTLNARAAVLAAANPLYGRYNFRKSISENINLPNSLLSRFDLLFVIIDRIEATNDIALSRHVLHVHRYLKNPEKTSIITPSTMKAFIAMARKFTPTVPKELTSYITAAYVSLRLQENDKILPHTSNDQTVMTPRQLLSILRLSQALARLRMSKVVTVEDVDESLRLMQASKMSLLTERTEKYSEDYASTIFSMMREAVSISTTRNILYSDLEGMILKRGFTSEQLQNCLREYQSLGIVQVDSLQLYVTLIS